MIDLRSDTVTQPSDGMRDAIANAQVGDDVYHDDPTVNALERMVADMLGTDDAVYVPTGTMSNQIALRVHTQPGDTVLLHTAAHIARHELGGAAHNSGVTLKGIGGEQGAFTAGQLLEAVPTPHPALPAHLFDPVTLVCVENTHNDAGGTVWNREQMAGVLDAAKDLGIATHLDGARLWNAAVATGTSVGDLASGFDTVNVCFSKGLGAPVGSALAGTHTMIKQARRFKQIFGGGFRQAGLLAAGAIYALENNRSRIADDHTNARFFAETIDTAASVRVDLAAVQTNLVYFDVPDASSFVDECLAEDVSMLALGQSSVRAVFHLDVSHEQTAAAAQVVCAIA